MGLPLCIGLALAPAAARADLAYEVPTDHARFAACAYSILDRAYPGMARLTDLRGADTIKITLEETSVGLVSSATNRFVDMDIRKRGKGAAVVIRGAWSLMGATFYAERAWREISGCASA
ncbi:hypothetical protein [Methylobacterium sp. Leaf118]|uniref:hypothetical protein n=1 Tax=Methylobacterium sp. Leaf118 TaxID=2876562 RepID=UPI001E5829C1|nr:hypothetical protein [Methylobacterium sp. Leaf118]